MKREKYFNDKFTQEKKKKVEFIANLPLDICDNIFFYLVETSYEYMDFLDTFPSQKKGVDSKKNEGHTPWTWEKYFDSKRFADHVVWIWDYENYMNYRQTCLDKRKFYEDRYHGKNKYSIKGLNSHIHVVTRLDLRGSHILANAPISHLYLENTIFIRSSKLINMVDLTVHKSEIICTIKGPIKNLNIKETIQGYYKNLKNSIGWEKTDFYCENVYLEPSDHSIYLSSWLISFESEMVNTFLDLLKCGKVKRLVLSHKYITWPHFEFNNFFGKALYKESSYRCKKRSTGLIDEKILTLEDAVTLYKRTKEVKFL